MSAVSSLRSSGDEWVDLSHLLEDEDPPPPAAGRVQAAHLIQQGDVEDDRYRQVMAIIQRVQSNPREYAMRTSLIFWIICRGSAVALRSTGASSAGNLAGQAADLARIVCLHLRGYER
ncbi:MAG: hypothetical protein S4CHLAM2_06540 [Chlamydiales bacterium]|nr:hypothetical protein [Chlamydiales bacterium]